MTMGRHAPPASGIAAVLVTVVLVACQGREPHAPAQREAPNPLLQPKSLAATAPETFRARFTTTKGDFVIEVHRAWAPRGADRFYNLVRNGFYDGDRIYRVLKDFMVQWGINPDPRIAQAWSKAYIVDDSVAQSNERGRVSFAKGGLHSRTAEVFINYRDNPSLDGQGFSPFGEVVEGMDVVESFYSGYGDGPPRGDGPYPAQALVQGESYFAAQFPELDRITNATLENR